MYTASTAFLEALVEAGVENIFVNLGSDHPGFVEAIAQARQDGRPIPRIVTSPHEFVALSAAHGHALVSGRAQAVVVHVECGTQNLGGGVHNAANGRVPVLIFAGASPFTQEGEMLGSRNEFIQWIQDVFDQRGIVRGYVKYDNELRTGKNLKQVVHRSLQFAQSEPMGPVYLMGAREVMEEETKPVRIDLAHWGATSPRGLAPEQTREIAKALAAARRPLVVTSYLGRKPEAVAQLVALCDRLGVGVLESVPSAMNFPHDNPMFVGVQWNQAVQNPDLDTADVVLVLDTDVPWIPGVSRPNAAATVFHIDLDVLKSRMPLFYIPATQRHQACTATALAQINAVLDETPLDEGAVQARRTHYAKVHAARSGKLAASESPPVDGAITIEFLMARLRAQLDDRSIIVNEAITNFHSVCDHLGMSRPGSIFTSGAGSLGWNGGAAIGVKLADPDATVVSICGDGSFLFSIPTTVHWMSREYNAPFLQIVLNNRGWKAPKLSLLGVHPDGAASRATSIDNLFDPPPDYAGVALASGAGHAAIVRKAHEVDAALAKAFDVVQREQRSAVLDVWLAAIG